MLKSNQTIAPTQFSQKENVENFRIHAEIEIHFILRAIMQSNTLLTLYFNHGNDFILTSILAVDPEHGEMVLDYGANEQFNLLALRSKKLTFITSHFQVKVQFICPAIRKTQFENRDAFSVDLPDSLLRMQRRDYYRIFTPVINPLKCIVPLPAGHGSDMAEVTLLDISCGGMAVIDHHPVIDFEPGKIYKNCRIALPGVGTLEVNVQVKSTFDFTLKNGLSCKRAGCEFIGINEKMLSMAQRYIIQLERERKAKLTGMG